MQEVEAAQLSDGEDPELAEEGGSDAGEAAAGGEPREVEQSPAQQAERGGVRRSGAPARWIFSAVHAAWLGAGDGAPTARAPPPPLAAPAPAAARVPAAPAAAAAGRACRAPACGRPPRAHLPRAPLLRARPPRARALRGARPPRARPPPRAHPQARGRVRSRSTVETSSTAGRRKSNLLIGKRLLRPGVWPSAPDSRRPRARRLLTRSRRRKGSSRRERRQLPAAALALRAGEWGISALVGRIL